VTTLGTGGEVGLGEGVVNCCLLFAAGGAGSIEVVGG